MEQKEPTQSGQKLIILNGIAKKLYRRSGGMEYKFNENIILRGIKQYVDDTYSEHYSHSKYQATDMIIDAGHGEGFCIGNIMKYAMRYGKKNGKTEKDLLKIIHYAIIALYLNEDNNDND